MSYAHCQFRPFRRIYCNFGRGNCSPNVRNDMCHNMVCPMWNQNPFLTLSIWFSVIFLVLQVAFWLQRSSLQSAVCSLHKAPPIFVLKIAAAPAPPGSTFSFLQKYKFYGFNWGNKLLFVELKVEDDSTIANSLKYSSSTAIQMIQIQRTSFFGSR